MPEKPPRPPAPKLDYDAARAAGASPLLIFLVKMHGRLAVAFLVWTGVFVLGVIVYHASGKPKLIIDTVVPVLASIFIALWLAAQATLFTSNFFIRKLYVAAFVSLFLHGAFLLFPLLNAFTIAAMAPELPGQGKPAAKPGLGAGGTLSSGASAGTAT